MNWMQTALAMVRTMEQWLAGSCAQPRLNTTAWRFRIRGAVDRCPWCLWRARLFGVPAQAGKWSAHRVGATLSSALRLIVGEGMKLVLIGIGSGLLAGLALGRTLSSLVFGVPVRDPVTFVTVAGTLAILALAAWATPALRGSRITPSLALRCE